MQKFKQEELIQFLYNETSTELTNAINEALQDDWELQDELKVLKRSLNQLDTLKMRSPRQSTVNSILKYAKLTDEVTHH